jgi:uncharacterized Zn finger protein
MTLTRRISNLESVHRQVLNACGTCGGHDPMRHPGVIVTAHDRPLPHCAECGAALTEQGTPLPRRFKRIIRQPRSLAS